MTGTNTNASKENHSRSPVSDGKPTSLANESHIRTKYAMPLPIIKARLPDPAWINCILSSRSSIIIFRAAFGLLRVYAYCARLAMPIINTNMPQAGISRPLKIIPLSRPGNINPTTVMTNPSAIKTRPHTNLSLTQFFCLFIDILLFGINENIFDLDPKLAGKLECQQDRWVVSPSLE